MPNPIPMAMIGCGGMARHHARSILRQLDTTRVAVVCEPSAEAYAAFAKVFTEADQPAPPNVPDLAQMLRHHEVQAAFIVTPHVYHHDQTQACLEAGVDVLLEKPMVMNAAEAQSLIALRDRTQHLLVVAFPGSLSPYLRAGVEMLRSGQHGAVQSISAAVWQNWGGITLNTWRQDLALS